MRFVYAQLFAPKYRMTCVSVYHLSLYVVLIDKNYFKFNFEDNAEGKTRVKFRSFG